MLGRRTVTLRPKPKRNVRIRLDVDPPIELARFTWFRLDTKADSIDGDRRGAGGMFDFDDLEPGRYRLVIRRPRAPRDVWESFVVQHEVELEIPPELDFERKVRVTRGGRLRLRVVDSNGVFLGGRCTITTSAGREVPARFLAGDSGGYVRGGIGRFIDRGENEADRALAPGSYVVRFAVPGRAPVERSVVIEAGKVARIEVELP